MCAGLSLSLSPSLCLCALGAPCSKFVVVHPAKISARMVHPIFENFDSKMFGVPSRLWLPLFYSRFFGGVLAQGSWTQCYKLAPQSAVPERRGWKSGSHSRDGIMGWLWLVGSLKSWVSFAEYRLFYRALLQKRPVILRSLLIVVTPYCNTKTGLLSKFSKMGCTMLGDE